MEGGLKPDDPGAEESAVAAALLQLNNTIATTGGNLIKVLEVAREQIDVVGATTVEIRNTVKVVDACIEAFVRPKMSKRVSDDKETGGEQKGCQAIGGEVNVQGSEPQLGQGVDFSGAPESDETSTFSAQRGSPFLPMLFGGFADDTLMMGSMLNIPDIPIMQPPVFPSQDGIASGRDSQRLTEVPPHNREKM
ncbi:hypothetical protein PIB30_025382 [Stylosanthes scabra]|uniref:Uncharacterized protein n=1 Tax=Stylosanthes scabra TaxID=79078 RepID=A0ABU6Z948_9FABA|nr:hypothetical protein [Stylosanthes scabra]